MARFPTYTDRWLEVVDSFRDAMRSGDALALVVTAADVRRVLEKGFPDQAASFSDEDVRQVLRVAVVHDGAKDRSVPRAIARAARQVLSERTGRHDDAPAPPSGD